MGSQGAQDVCTKFNLCFSASENISDGVSFQIDGVSFQINSLSLSPFSHMWIVN